VAVVLVATAATALLLATLGPGTGESPGERGLVGQDVGGGQILLPVYDVEGNRLSWKEFRHLQSNGHGSSAHNDMIVDPVTLSVRQPWPLYPADGVPALDRPAGPAALSLAWPTAQGYSTLILDLPAPGTYVFNLLAARSAVHDLESQRAARTDYVPSPAFLSAWRTARSELALAGSASTPSRQGVHGTRAYESAVRAEVLLLKEYGTQFARSRRDTFRPAWGVTFDRLNGASAGIASMRRMLRGDPGDGWVRIVFDRGRPASRYRDVVVRTHEAGLHVLGQFLDSSDLAAVGPRAWRERVADYVTTLPLVDEWEVGNEVNGRWLGTGVLDKISYAATYVKHHSRARTLLTLYWQLGEDDAAHSLFTWADRHLDPTVLGRIDDVGISVYPGQHPLGAAFDRVFRTLHQRFPAQRVLVSELGYGSAELSPFWWWGSPTDPGAGRTAVASLYTRAVLGYPYSGGGAYWWYYLTEAPVRSPVWSAIASAHATVTDSEAAQ
jgi:hypothetical protein